MPVNTPMAEKVKFPRQRALEIAGQIIAQLTPVTCRIEIAGSLRRGKEHVGDIELLFIPKIKWEKDGLFDEKAVDMAAAEIESLFDSGLIGKRLNVAGYTSAWGPKNKLAVHIPSGIPIDFFSTTPENWFVSLVIRTGSKETNLKLTTGAQARGGTLHAYGDGVTDRLGNKLTCISEEDVFRCCGVPYLQPHQR